MDQERKQGQTAHYDSKIKDKKEHLKKDWKGEYPFIPSSYRFLTNYLYGKCYGKKILDYGCGYGVHSFWLSKLGAGVTGIDLSEKAIDVAKAKGSDDGYNPVFVKMDCENLNFKNDYFDIVFEDGALPSLNFERAMAQIVKVLKPNGFLIGIETFGHNPITNFKRWINTIVGKRTKWEASHIFSINNISRADKFFGKTQVYYFHPLSWIAFPFLRIPGAKSVLGGLEYLDKILLKIPYLKKYSFKAVFIFSNPKKNV